jgi:hypothetical protein
VLALGGALALAAKRRPRRTKHALRDYSSRSGFPRPPHEMRGLARRQEVARSLTEASSVQPAALQHHP